METMLLSRHIFMYDFTPFHLHCSLPKTKQVVDQPYRKWFKCVKAKILLMILILSFSVFTALSQPQISDFLVWCALTYQTYFCKQPDSFSFTRLGEISGGFPKLLWGHLFSGIILCKWLKMLMSKKKSQVIVQTVTMCNKHMWCQHYTCDDWSHQERNLTPDLPVQWNLFTPNKLFKQWMPTVLVHHLSVLHSFIFFNYSIAVEVTCFYVF